MNEQRHRILDHPILFGVVFTYLSFFCCLGVAGVAHALLDAAGILSDNGSTYVSACIGYGVVGPIFLALVKRTIDPGYRLFSAERLGQALALLWPFYVVAALNLVNNFVGGTPLADAGVDVALCVVYAMFIGYFEETVFRGAVISNAMRVWKDKENRVVWCMLLSAIPFGLVHISNIAYMGGMAFLQCLWAMAFGVLFAAVYLRTGNLLACVIAHGLIDATAEIFVSSHEITLAGTATIVALIVLGVGAAVFLVRRSKRGEIEKNFRPLGSSQLAAASD